MESKQMVELRVRRARKGRITAWLASCSSCGALQDKVGPKAAALRAVAEHSGTHPDERLSVPA